MSKQSLYLLKYNNYYNRINKRYETLSEYLNNEDVLATYFNINFNPNDGLQTTQILNYDDKEDPDYLLVVDEDIDFPILSRWFIIETKRERGGQYKLTLYRDVISDNYNDVLTAPTFIEKATIRDINDPAIFNDESMGFNEVKKSEKLIKDRSQIGWIVGYVARDTDLPNISVTAPADPMTVDYTVDSISNWQYFPYTTRNAYYDSTWYGVFRSVIKLNYGGTDRDRYYKYETLFDRAVGDISYKNITTVDYTTESSKTYQWIPSTSTAWKPRPSFEKALEYVVGDYNLINTYVKDALGEAPNIDLSTLDGQVIKDNSTGLFYRIKANVGYDDSATLISAQAQARLKNRLDISLFSKVTWTDNYTIELKYSAKKVRLVLEPITVNIQATFASKQTRRHLLDSPYDMFCIPYGEIKIITDSRFSVLDPNPAYYFTTSPSAAIALAQQLKAQEGISEKIYDLQLLPYCPIRNAVTEASVTFPYANIKQYNQTTSSIITADGVNASVLFWCDSSNFEFTVGEDIRQGSTVLDRKVNNETKKYRLCSPNFAAGFEFSAEKNNGVKGYNIVCSYKPYTPYIKVAPIFAGLYGSNYNDGRGLICSGDFSIASIGSEWADYELRNKNYQLAFDRQIESMELNNSIQRINDVVGAISGTVSGGLTGAAGGALLGGGAGAIAGGIGGTLVGAAGGVADVVLNEKLRNEAIDYAKDQFGYQLGNIKALPYTLNKVGAQNADYKIFPFLETYDCTEVERQALIDKLTYNGMTIMRIGKIADFIGDEISYIKGQIIRLDDVHDFDISNAIANELNKGVFI